MAMEPPPFQEAPRCDVCNCSFSTFRRRHHCRCCGRTLCYEHSSNQMALPKYGIHSQVRVCADCFNNSRSKNVDPQVPPDRVDGVADKMSKLDIDKIVDSNAAPSVEKNSTSSNLECKCGMPLCICEVSAPSNADVIPQPLKTTPTYTTQSNPKPKKNDTVAKIRGSTSNSKCGSVFNVSQVTNGMSDIPQMEYEANGEGLREAIKNGDAFAVKKLLNQGVDANYRDRQGMSLLHLAAVFNKTDIVFTLMDFGANLEYKNAQGETPLDCAPATLQYKMRQRMEEGKA